MNRVLLYLILLATIIPQTGFSDHVRGVAIEFEPVSPCTVHVKVRQYRSCNAVPFQPAYFTWLPDSAGFTPPSPIGNWVLTSTTLCAPWTWIPPNICAGTTIGELFEEVWERDFNYCTADTCNFTLQMVRPYRTPGTSLPNPANTWQTVRAGPFNPGNPNFNASPRWVFPPTYLFTTNPLTQHSWMTVDPDGDSLVYSLTPCIDQFGNPLTYNPGYSHTSPFGPAWQVNLDSHTGILTFMPNPGSTFWAEIAMKVSEYRNGQLIGESTREASYVCMASGVYNTSPVVTLPSAHSGPGYVSNDSIFVCAGDSVWMNLYGTDPNPFDTLDILLPVPGSWYSLRDSANPTPRDTVTGVNPTAQLSFRAPQPGVYLVPVRVKDYTLSVYNYYDKVLTIIAKGPGQAWANTSTNCLEATFEATACGGPWNYTWSGTGGINANPANNQPAFTHQFSAPGTYAWQLVVDSAGVVMDSLSGTVTVNTNSTALPGLLTGGSPVPCDLTPVSLSATPGFSAYLWSNGSSTPSISTAVAGFYSVSVTDTLGCEFVDSITVQADTIADISGVIRTSGGAFLAGQDVILIRLDSTGGGTLTAIDTTQTDASGYYKFCDVTDTVVFVKALPDSAAYPGELPTYADSTLFWNTATPYSVAGTPYQVNFSTLPGTNPGGPGFIGGLVSLGANKTTGPGDPVAGLDIILRDASSQTPVAHTRTDSNGNFSFGNLPVGDYEVAADWPYVDEVNVPVIPLGTWPVRDSLDFRLHSTYFEWVQLTQVDAAELPTLSLSPNPTSGVLQIRCEGNPNGRLELISVDGKVLYSTSLQANTHRIHLTALGLKNGMYLVKWISDTGILTKCLILSD